MATGSAITGVRWPTPRRRSGGSRRPGRMTLPRRHRGGGRATPAPPGGGEAPARRKRTMAAHDRPTRVAHEFQRELGEILARGLKDPRITGFITVTGAKMAPDL